MKRFIASVLYCLGFQYSVTMFIDEHTFMYGYGPCHGIGVFEYPLEYQWILNRIEKKQKEFSQ